MAGFASRQAGLARRQTGRALAIGSHSLGWQGALALAARAAGAIAPELPAPLGRTDRAGRWGRGGRGGSATGLAGTGGRARRFARLAGTDVVNHRHLDHARPVGGHRAAGPDGAGRRRGGDLAGQPQGADLGAEAGGARGGADRGGQPGGARGRGQHQGLEGDARHDRQQDRQRGALAAHLLAEGAAALALAQVLAQHRAPQRAPAQHAELLADALAAQLARLAALGQRLPGPEHQRLHLLGPAAEDLGDLGVGDRAQLREQQGLALLDGQPRQVGEHRPQVLAPLDLDGEAGGRDLDRVAGLLAAAAEHRDAVVAGDPVEPGAQVDLPLAGEHRLVGVEEGLLDGVLGLLRGDQHVAAEGEQAAVVAVVDELEGALVAGSDGLDQAAVAGGPEQGHNPQASAWSDRGGACRASFHCSRRRRIGMICAIRVVTLPVTTHFGGGGSPVLTPFGQLGALI